MLKGYVPKEGRGYFATNKKLKDNHPDLKGEMMVGGKSYKIAGWIKNNQYGQLISFQVEDFKLAAERGPVERESGIRDSDVPF